MKTILPYFLLLLLFFTFYNGSFTISASKQALQIWAEILVPSLFFPTLCIRILMEYLSFEFLKTPIFNIYSSRYLIIGWLLGYPNYAIYLEEACANGNISSEACTRLLYSISCCSMPFLFLTIGHQLFQNTNISFLFFLSLFISNLLLLFLTRKQPIYAPPFQLPKQSFFTICRHHLLATAQSLFFIGGYILICYVLMAIFPQNPLTPILSILIEFSSGTFILAKTTSLYQLPLISALLAFAGFCVHLQTFSTFHHIKIRYAPYLAYRILQSLFVFILVFLFQFLL